MQFLQRFGLTSDVSGVEPGVCDNDGVLSLDSQTVNTFPKVFMSECKKKIQGFIGLHVD